MFQFLQKKIIQKICNKGTINCASGGGVSQSMVKDRTFTFFFYSSLTIFLSICKILF